MTDIPHGLVLGKVMNRVEWNNQLFSLHVQAPVSPYLAGQFTKLAVFNGDELIRRAYSMVNHPEHKAGHQNLEFLIIKDADGQLSPKLHKLGIGDEVYVGKDPSGFMTLDEIPATAKDLWLLSTGTAIGPFLAMLETQGLEDRFDHLILVHAVRTENDLTYSQRISQLTSRLKGKLQYVPIISREHVSGSLRGRIPTLLLRGELERATQLPISKRHSFFYLCGNPAMVRDTSDALKELGLTKHLRKKAGQFSSENYW